MHGFDSIGLYHVVAAIAAVLVAILVWQPFREKRTLGVWLTSGVLGVLLGSVVTYAGMRLNGYELPRSAVPPLDLDAVVPGSCGGPGTGCPTGGGFSGPRPKRDLTILVQRLDLLTGDIGITLTAEQAAAIDDCLRDIEESTTMSPDDAKAKHHQLMAVLNEDQKERLEAFEALEPARGGGPATGCPLAGGAGMQQDKDRNPFDEDAEGRALSSLRERLASRRAPPSAKTPKAAPAKADAPTTPPPKANASNRAAAKP